MSKADKVGILPGFGWIVDLNPWLALLAAWLITPGMVWFIGYVLESRVPMFNRYTFLSFVPGDFFLGIVFASSVALSQYLPLSGWYQSTAWQWTVFVGAFVACLLMRQFGDKPNYTNRALWSPTKVYHDFCLYWIYGYLMFTVAVPSVFLSEWSSETMFLKIIALGAFLSWISTLIYDNVFCAIPPKEKAKHAHTSTPIPIWYQ